MSQLNKESIILDLMAYGEKELAEKAEELTDEQIAEIHELASKSVCRGGNAVKTIVYGVIEYFEGQCREPKRKHRNMSVYNN